MIFLMEFRASIFHISFPFPRFYRGKIPPSFIPTKVTNKTRNYEKQSENLSLKRFSETWWPRSSYHCLAKMLHRVLRDCNPKIFLITSQEIRIKPRRYQRKSLEKFQSIARACLFFLGLSLEKICLNHLFH